MTLGYQVSSVSKQSAASADVLKLGRNQSTFPIRSQNSINKLVVKQPTKRKRHMSVLVRSDTTSYDSGWFFETSGLNLKLLQDAHIIAASMQDQTNSLRK